jgi:hypothetical protein
MPGQARIISTSTRNSDRDHTSTTNQRIYGGRGAKVQVRVGHLPPWPSLSLDSTSAQTQTLCITIGHRHHSMAAFSIRAVLAVHIKHGSHALEKMRTRLVGDKV